MNERYIINQNAFTKEAIMIIEGEIGSDIKAKDFIDELHQLESDGIENITIRINSGGGSVIEAYSIFSNILHSTSTITTYNFGIVASSAGWIFLAGNNAVMADYSLLMMHNPSSPDVSAIGQKRVEYMRNSIATILSKRSGVKVDKIENMMNVETWLTADEAVKQGFASSVRTTEKLVELNPVTQTVNDMYLICNSAFNKKSNIMSETNEQAEDTVTVYNTVENAIEQVEEKVEETIEQVEEIVKDVVNTVEDIALDNKLDIVNVYVTKITELENELNSLKEAELKRVNNEKQKAGMELVSNAISVGKIKADSSAEWVTMATNNYEFTKTTLDSILVTKKGLDIMNNLKVSNEKPKMGMREMEMNDPKKLEDIYTNNITLFNQMYFEQYGKHRN